MSSPVRSGVGDKVFNIYHKNVLESSKNSPACQGFDCPCYLCSPINAIYLTVIQHGTSENTYPDFAVLQCQLR